MGSPIFRMPAAVGKYTHPWMQSLPQSRSQAYDYAYKAAATLLFVGAMWGFVEVGRGSYYIAMDNHGTPVVPSGSDKKVGWRNTFIVTSGPGMSLKAKICVVSKAENS